MVLFNQLSEVMKKILYFTAFVALIALSACAEKESLEFEQGSDNKVDEYPVFTASIDFGTKAWTIYGDIIYWGFNEEIIVKDNRNISATYVTEQSGNSEKFAKLVRKEGVAVDVNFGEPPFTATINNPPANEQSYDYYAQNDKLYLEAKTSKKDQSDPDAYTLKFTAKNALLAIKFIYETKLKEIRVEGIDGENNALSYTLLMDDRYKKDFAAASWNKSIEHQYLIAVMPGTYNKITIVDTCKSKNTYVFKADPAINVVANDYFSIPLSFENKTPESE